ALNVVRAQVACVGQHLVKARSLGRVRPFELEHHDDSVLQDNDIGSASVARKSVLQDRPVVRSARFGDDVFPRLSLELRDPATPRGALFVARI
ncbi:MAG: hypothetical protein ACK55I_32410, partial [bacterium]